jgi:hypothetical protein
MTHLPNRLTLELLDAKDETRNESDIEQGPSLKYGLTRRWTHLQSGIRRIGRGQSETAALDPLRCFADNPATSRSALSSAGEVFHSLSHKKELHGGGFGPHPRTKVRDLSDSLLMRK